MQKEEEEWEEEVRAVRILPSLLVVRWGPSGGAVALLLLASLALLSFLAPPLDRRRRHHHHHYFSIPVPPLPKKRPPPPLVRNLVRDEGSQFTSGGRGLWGSAAAAGNYYGCSNASDGFEMAGEVTRSDRYLMIATSGGLNQQRTGITDAVVVARILNATLVVPELDQKSFWKDSSNFTEIFDVDRFISFLSRDVRILKQLPHKGGKVVGTPHSMRVPRKCTVACYQKRVLPILLKKHVVQLTKFDYRLTNKLKTDLQKLRCRVNYHALKFTGPILKMGEKLIQRMKSKSEHFIAIHLRFEPDMLAFSRCYYGGGDKERRELGVIRKRWKTLHASDPDKQGRQGKCPLTPEQLGLMLRALGFGSNDHVYVASGEVYGGEETLAPLKTFFPNFHTKETLASKEELAPFSTFSSRMAALDFTVCDGSDVFVPNNNGNMARMLAGRRRYFGHKRTIRPNAKKLYSLFRNQTSMTWDEFASGVHTYQKGFTGEPNEVKPGRGEFHENPSSCICDHNGAMSADDYSLHNMTLTGSKKGEGILSRRNHEPVHLSDEEPDWLDFDYRENVSLGKDSSSRNESDCDIFLKPEDLDLEEILSD